MPQITVHGPIERNKERSAHEPTWNVLVRDMDELTKFWRDNQIDTLLDWAGMDPPKVTVGRQELIARCVAAGEGAEVEYDMETDDRRPTAKHPNGFHGVKGIDLRVIMPAAVVF
jgi:hypothetical protein